MYGRACGRRLQVLGIVKRHLKAFKHVSQTSRLIDDAGQAGGRISQSGSEFQAEGESLADGFYHGNDAQSDAYWIHRDRSTGQAIVLRNIDRLKKRKHGFKSLKRHK